MGNAGIATEFLRMCARGEVGEAWAPCLANASFTSGCASTLTIAACSRSRASLARV